MKFRIRNLFFILILMFSLACSDDDKPNTPIDYSDMIKGNWEGFAVNQSSDTLLFEMTLDATQNNVTGASKFAINNESREDFTISGVITYPKVNLTFTSPQVTIEFDGQFSATNPQILSGVINSGEYHDIQTTFTKQ